MDQRKSKISISLRVQLIGGIILAILLTVVAINIVFIIISNNDAQDAAGRVYENLSFNIADLADKNIANVHYKLSAFSQISEIANPATPVDERVAASRAAAVGLGSSVLSLKMTDLDGKELVMSDEPEIDLSDRNYIQAALGGRTFVTSPFFSAIVNRMVLVIAQPLTWDNEIVGAIFMLLPGDFLNDAIESAKAGYEGYACAFDSNGDLISHTDIIGILERGENQYIEMAKTDRAYEGMAEAVQTMLSRKNGTLIYSNPDNEQMLGGFSSTSQGWVVLVCSTVDDVLTDTNRAIQNAIIASVICMLIVIVIAFFLLGTIVKRISLAAKRLDRMAHGDLTSPVPETNSGSEVGVLVRSLGEVVNMIRAYITDITDTLVAIENGRLDHTSQQEYKGDFTAIKKALAGITSGLSSSMGSIMDSTEQVSAGSKQIADGAQAIAQGATEQAASIEELSSSIAEIANQTIENAAMAEDAAKLADTIKGNAEKGSRQMDEMIAAVNEISDASGQIGKVIRVIDDIAFQTNILALNAAVEAARAGQHGKGFAVVAEEVRNLAAKSAEAAKDTGGLIENSIEKANLGVRIAGETAASLTEIVSGINESNRLVVEIAKSSEAQSSGIAQINIGIDQVAQVVQQNSATAEESAAASEEMSGQSAMLEDLISRYSLADRNAANPGFSSPARISNRKITMPKTAAPVSDSTGNYGKY